MNNNMNCFEEQTASNCMENGSNMMIVRNSLDIIRKPIPLTETVSESERQNLLCSSNLHKVIEKYSKTNKEVNSSILLQNDKQPVSFVTTNESLPLNLVCSTGQSDPSFEYIRQMNTMAVTPESVTLMPFSSLAHDHRIMIINGNEVINPLDKYLNRPQHKFLYSSNGSVSDKVIHCIYHYLSADPDKVKEEMIQTCKTGNTSLLCREIALVLSHKLNLFIRIDDTMYMFNGIYTQEITLNHRDVPPYIRELCEVFSHVISEFTCTELIARKVRDELKQVSKVVNSADLKQNWHYIAFQNCVLDVLTMQTSAHSPSLILTKAIMCDYNPSQNYHPYFDASMRKYAGDDSILYQRILESLGLLLTNDYNPKMILCFIGVSNSGKSVLIDSMVQLINPESRICGLNLENLTDKFGLVKLKNKNLACCMDLSARQISPDAASIIKQLSGGDELNVETKFVSGAAPMHFNGHLILGSNYEISTVEPDAAFEMRKVVIPFQYKIEDGLPKDLIQGYLRSEATAIVNTLLEAYTRLRLNGYHFSGEGSWYNQFVPENRCAEVPVQRMIQRFIEETCDITGNSEDYLFTEDLFYQFCNQYPEHYQEIHLGEFSKIIHQLYSIDLTKAKKRRNKGDISGQSCFVGIKWKMT